MEKNYYGALDYVLKSVIEIAARKKLHKDVLDNIQDLVIVSADLKRLYGIEDYEEALLFKQLITDGNIDQDKKILLKGATLIKNGGYSEKIRMENYEFYRQRKLEKYLRYLQTIIALGTSVAAYYYLNELNHYYQWFGF